jgi:hypothetical protein
MRVRMFALFTKPRSSISRACAFKAQGWWCESTRGCHFNRRCRGDEVTMRSAHAMTFRSHRRSQCLVTSAPTDCRASPTWQRRCAQTTEDLGSTPRRGTHFNAPVAQSSERRASNAEVEGANPSGSAISKRNANRTSAPGLVANEIVPPLRGMGSMPSAFRHFICPRMQSRRATGPSNLV